VEGLTPDNVTVIDSQGNVLSKQWEAGSNVGLTASQHDLQEKVEKHLEQKAESMLSTVLGAGKSIVRVSAELNFQKIERTNERYDPDNIAILSEERTEDLSTAETGESNGSLEHTITNYQVPKTVEHITNTVGNITRLSLAVLVDGKRNPVVDAAGNTTYEYEPRTQEEMEMLSAVVKNAVGFDDTRNDQFEITNFAFDTQNLFPEEVESAGFTIDSAWNIGQKVLPFLFLGILLFILRSRLKKVKLSMPPVGRLGSGGFGPPLQPGPVETIEETSHETMESAQLLKQISEFAEEKPALAARVLRYWMIEE
jgi:flagellar M-ring protein FliF